MIIGDRIFCNAKRCDNSIKNSIRTAQSREKLGRVLMGKFYPRREEILEAAADAARASLKFLEQGQYGDLAATADRAGGIAAVKAIKVSAPLIRKQVYIEIAAIYIGWKLGWAIGRAIKNGKIRYNREMSRSIRKLGVFDEYQ